MCVPLQYVRPTSQGIEMTPAEIESCADHLGEQEIYWDELQNEIAEQFPDEIATIAKDASQWVVDEVADPTEELAAIYRQAAQYWNSPEQIGYYVKAFLDGKITGVLEASISK